MSIKINYKNTKSEKQLNNQVLFTDEKFNINPLRKYIALSEFSYVKDLLKISDLKKNFIIFKLSSKKRIVLISIKKNIQYFNIENLGAEFYGLINYGKNTDYSIITDSIISKLDNFVSHFLHGLKLKSYEFDKYKTKKETRHITINVFGKKGQPSAKSKLKFKALEDGTFYTRDLVSEPGNKK